MPSHIGVRDKALHFNLRLSASRGPSIGGALSCKMPLGDGLAPQIPGHASLS